MVGVADTASIMCLGTIIFSGAPAAAQQYYRRRCTQHMAALGAQPWNEALPEVQAALASNGNLPEGDSV
jgi:hypothetical protein